MGSHMPAYGFTCCEARDRSEAAALSLMFWVFDSRRVVSGLRPACAAVMLMAELELRC